jgi:Protein of unknown function (DUF3072)
MMSEQRLDHGAGQTERTPEKDPEDWVTGDEPMTGPQESYLRTLAREAGEEIDPATRRRRPPSASRSCSGRRGAGGVAEAPR